MRGATSVPCRLRLDMIPALIYILACAVGALTTALLGGRPMSALIWGGGALVLVFVLVRNVRRRAAVANQSPSTAAVALALLLKVAAVYVAFVVMVNIWERLGLPH
jgi:hypothetical protein